MARWLVIGFAALLTACGYASAQTVAPPPPHCTAWNGLTCSRCEVPISTERFDPVADSSRAECRRMPAGRGVRVHATGIATIHPPECVRAASHWYGSITLRALYGHSQPSSPFTADRGYQYNLADVPVVTTDPLVPRGGPVVAYVSWAATDVFCEGGVQATVLRPLALSRATLVFESMP